MAGQIDCPAPFTEGPIDALLTKMLTPPPYKVPEKTKKAKGARKSSCARRRRTHRPMTLRRTLPPKTRKKKKKLHPHRLGETGKGRPPQPGRPEGPRREGLSFRTVPPPPPTANTSDYSGPSPWRSRKYSDTRVTHSIPLSHCFS